MPREYITAKLDEEELIYTFVMDLRGKGLKVMGRDILEIGMQTVEEYDLCDDLYLLYDIYDVDDYEELANDIYCDEVVENVIRGLLSQCGFSAEACEDVCFSESGMQEGGRASFDAYEIAQEIVNA